MHPRGHRDRCHTVPQHNHLFRPDPIFAREVPDKVIHIPNDVGETVGITSLARRAPMPALVPCNDGNILQL